MMENEVREMIAEELIDFLDGYIIIHAIVHGGFNTEIIP